MKKLMIVGAAALCATVGFGAITSENTVGFQENQANASRNTMMAPTFLTVGSAAGCTLADLTVSGYAAPVLIDEEEGEYEGGCAGGEFILNFLNPDGTNAARYYWIDDGETGPGWFSSALGGEISGGAASVNVPAGKGAWIYGSGMTLNIPAPEL